MTDKNDTKIALMAQDIQYIKDSIKEIESSIKEVKGSLDSNYVKKEDIKIVWYLIYALIGAVVSYSIPLFFAGK